jgi:hypothetical protein
MKEVIFIKDLFVNSFLKDIKKKVAQRQYTLADREKNNDFLRERGLSLEHVREAILRLSDKDKPVGPQEDRGGYPGYVYKFKSEYLTDEVIYIKIRYNPPDEVVCISFHQDENIK